MFHCFKLPIRFSKVSFYMFLQFRNTSYIISHQFLYVLLDQDMAESDAAAAPAEPAAEDPAADAAPAAAPELPAEAVAQAGGYLRDMKNE